MTHNKCGISFCKIKSTQPSSDEKIIKKEHFNIRISSKYLVSKQMKKRTFSNIKTKLAILMLVLYLISMIAIAISTGTSNSANTRNKDNEKLSGNINHDGQRGNISVPIKVNTNHSTVTIASTAA